MDETCPTCKVKAENDLGFMVINQIDFDPKLHERFEDEEKPRVKPGPKPKAKE